MSRIAKLSLTIPAGVELKQVDNKINVKGPKGALELVIVESVAVQVEDNQVSVKPKKEGELTPMLGTTRVLLGNMIQGVEKGFERALRLVGVGYRAKAQGKTLELSLGFSHPVKYELPEGITAETPSATDIILKSHDKQLLGQVAAEIRAYRPPEVYKGKGVRYADERVILKETKKK